MDRADIKLSVNILTWNTWPTLHDTLHVLTAELKDIDSEIIIVDNGSTDGCQNVATIKNLVNLGISKGKNQGIDESKGDFIMMLDGDVVPVPNSIKCLLNYMETHADIEALGFYPDKWARNKSDYGYQDYCYELNPVEKHTAGRGQGWCNYYGMYRRSCFDRGLRFDESFGVGYGWEDADFAQTMLNMGIIQWVAGINTKTGKYLHAINSSIRNMGFEKYMETSKERGRMFSAKWKEPVLC